MRFSAGDHPRVCGEKLLFLLSLDIEQGSPPRVRGKVPVYLQVCKTPGITPACAGKRSERGYTTASSKDHPRVCGEKESVLKWLDDFAGSPPRVRGKDRRTYKEFAAIGITPACAGKSVIIMSPRSVIQDHPRVCGEKHLECNFVQPSQGSPPRVRGKVLYMKLIVPFQGITPACAGKRRRTTHARSATEDHPRVCGEK